MKLLLVIGVCALATLASGQYHPQPMKQSEAEAEFCAAVDKEGNATERLRIAKEYLERYPNDVPLGRYAASIIYQSSIHKSDAVEYLRMFADAHHREIGPQYYYARIADDTLIWDEKARWALARDSTNYWAWLMWMAAEWHKSNPEMSSVMTRIEKAIALDSSRPEAFMFLGDAHGEQGNWLSAIEAYEAGLVCDSSSNPLRLRLEDAKDELRKKVAEQPTPP